MKCLEKHRERRYETANALARDVQRYLDGDAVEACPPSVGYRMGKFLKRNKGPVLAASFVLLALVAGFIGTAWGLVRADRARQAEAAQRRIAVEQKKKAEASEALAKEQRSRAETREEQAIDAVKKFRDAVANNPELKNNPALELAPQDAPEGAAGVLQGPARSPPGRPRHPARIAGPPGRRPASTWAI